MPTSSPLIKSWRWRPTLVPQKLAKAGQPRKWLALGRRERAVWGECQGSAREPYRTQIDLNEPAFRCRAQRSFPASTVWGSSAAGQPASGLRAEGSTSLGNRVARQTRSECSAAHRQARAPGATSQRGNIKNARWLKLELLPRARQRSPLAWPSLAAGCATWCGRAWLAPQSQPQ